MSYKQNNPLSRKSSPLNEGGYCAKSAGKSGCVKKEGDSWRVISNKTGKLWGAHYSSKADAEAGLRAYHGGFSRKSSEEEYMPIEDDMHKRGEGDMGMSRQGYNDRLDESLARDGDESTKTQSFKDRRDESKGTEKSKGKGAYSSDPGMSRKSSSPLNNTGMTGLNYSKELQYMPIEDDMHRGMSRKTNTWEEEDVKKGRKEEREGHKGYADALYDDAHDSYNWRPGMDTHAEHGTSRRSSSPLNDHHGFKQFPTSVHKKPADPLEGVPYPERDWEGESDYMEQRDSIKPMKMKLEKNIKRIEKPVKRMMMSQKLTKIDKPRSGGPR